MMKKRIVFYSDSTTFGGHEYMTAFLANRISVLLDYEVSIVFFHKKYKDILLPNIKQINIPFYTKVPFPLFRNFNFVHVYTIKDILYSLNPTLVIISQGNIELGLKGLFASKILGLTTVSYIPLAYSFKQMGGSLWFIRDITRRTLFNLPDAYITISNHQAQIINRISSCRKKVFVVTNPVDLNFDAETRSEYRLNHSIYKIAIVGRVFFKHKNQDILIHLTKKVIRQNLNIKFFVIGDGPDLKKLKKHVLCSNLTENIEFLGEFNRDELYSFLCKNIDLVLIPSYYEGVPLVMLEAFQLCIPCLIANADFVRDYNLPSAYVFNREDVNDVLKKILYFRSGYDKDEFSRVRREILDKHTINVFDEELTKAIIKLVEQ